MSKPWFDFEDRTLRFPADGSWTMPEAVAWAADHARTRRETLVMHFGRQRLVVEPDVSAATLEAVWWSQTHQALEVLHA